MSRPSRGAAPAWIGIVLGVVGLAVVACFAIFLPKADKDPTPKLVDVSSAARSKDPLTLPDKLPGGYIASDLPEAFATSTFKSQAQTIAANEATNRSYADNVLSAVLDEAVATRVYAGAGATTRISVQAFRAGGGAFSPPDLPDPKSASNSSSQVEFLRQDDAACSLTVPASSATTPGQTAQQPTTSTCQQSQDGVTVQLTAQGLSLPQISQLIVALLDQLT